MEEERTIKLVIAILLTSALIWWFFYHDRENVMPEVDPKDVANHGVPAAPTGDGKTVVIDPTQGQTSGAGSPDADQSSTSGTTSNPLAGVKFVRLYAQPDFKGKTTILLPGMTTDLATKSGSNWVFNWKSMRVVPQVKLEFTRYTGGGRTSRAFAFGLFDVKDIKKWMLSLPAISGNPSIDHGMAMNRDWSGGSNVIKLLVNSSDAEWRADMNKVQQGCLNTIAAWNRMSPGRYQPSYCASSLYENASKTATISV